MIGERSADGCLGLGLGWVGLGGKRVWEEWKGGRERERGGREWDDCFLCFLGSVAYGQTSIFYTSLTLRWMFGLTS